MFRKHSFYKICEKSLSKCHSAALVSKDITTWTDVPDDFSIDIETTV